VRSVIQLRFISPEINGSDPFYLFSQGSLRPGYSSSQARSLRRVTYLELEKEHETETLDYDNVDHRDRVAGPGR
jgi:hypothetical protein